MPCKYPEFVTKEGGCKLKPIIKFGVNRFSQGTAVMNIGTFTGKYERCKKLVNPASHCGLWEKDVE